MISRVKIMTPEFPSTDKTHRFAQNNLTYLPFNNHGHTLAAANAHGYQTQTRVLPFHLV
jgi:hypothetical protein